MNICTIKLSARSLDWIVIFFLARISDLWIVISISITILTFITAYRINILCSTYLRSIFLLIFFLLSSFLFFLRILMLYRNILLDHAGYSYRSVRNCLRHSRIHTTVCLLLGVLYSKADARLEKVH